MVNSVSPRPIRPSKWTVVAVVFFTTLFTVFVESRALAPALAGTPTYESLDVVTGSLLQAEMCNLHARGPHSMPIWVMAGGKRQKMWLPCTERVEELRSQIGVQIEVRSRMFKPGILESPLADVWSVKADNQEIYSYEDRAKRSGQYMLNYIGAIVFPIVEASFLRILIWAYLRPNTK